MGKCDCEPLRKKIEENELLYLRKLETLLWSIHECVDEETYKTIAKKFNENMTRIYETK